MRWFGAFAVGLLLVAGFGLPAAQAQDVLGPVIEKPREWTINAPGGVKKLDARLVGLKRGVVEFQRANGQSVSVPLEQLSQEDRRAALSERVGSGVVVLATKDLFDEPSGLGSGFVMHPSGLILTNYHVISGAGKVEVTFRDVKEPQEAEVLSVDRAHDVAFLRVQPLPEGTHVVELQSSQMPVSGSSGWRLGHPSGLKNTVGWGDVNAVRKTDDMPEQIRKTFKTPGESRWLQTNAVLARGSSGGPLLNEQGQAVGVNTLLLGPQIGFAIHISHAHKAYLETKEARAMELPLPPGEHQDAMAWPSREVAPLLKEYMKEHQALEKAAGSLPRQETLTRLSAMQAKYRQMFFDLGQRTPGDWPGLQALAYAAEFCGDKEAEPELQKICELALEHNAQSLHLSAIVKAVGKQPSDIARAFCRQVKQASPHKLVQAGANYHLAANLLRWLQAPDSMETAKMKQFRAEIDTLVEEMETEFKQSDSPLNGEDGEAIVKAFREEIEGLVLGVKAREIKGDIRARIQAQ